jgi:hypothetical protein
MKYPHHLVGSCRSLVLLGCLAVLGSGSGRAQVLLQDDFGGSGSLNGRTPDTADTGGAKWVDGSGGTNTISGGVDNYSMNDSNFAAIPFAGSNFVDGDTYALSADFTFTNPQFNGTSWMGIGFTDGNPGSAFGNGMAWMINSGTGTGVTGFADVFGSSVGSAGNVGLDSGTMEIQLAIGATGAGSVTFLIGPDAAHLTAFNPGAPLTLTASQVQSITGVGFYGYSYNGPPVPTTGTFDNFTLEAPEPNVYAMLIVGLGGLVLVRRLSRSSHQV